MENFTALRNGILEHRRAGKMPPFDSGIFDHLLTRCNWETGIYHGCALALAFDFGDVSLKEAIQRCLRRLRDRKYINYPEGTGKRGGYDILIHKYEVAKGKLSGMRLNAWANNGLASPEYEPQNGRHTVDTRSANGGQTVGTPIQDIQDIQDGRDKASTHPSLEQVMKYCAERKNQVDAQTWFNHYCSNGWKVGRNAMKDWKAAIRTWERNGVNQEHGKHNESPTDSTPRVTVNPAIVQARQLKEQMQMLEKRRNS
jgi:hypothetical protein